ncbi:MAG: hypothetical protein ACM31H_06165 [Nitrososphaerales archaeon]
MFKANYSPTSGIIRVVENDDPNYVAIVSINWNGDDDVFLFGLHGEATRESLLTVFEKLYELGARSATLTRLSGKKFPFAIKGKTKGNYTEWNIPDISMLINILKRN